MSVFIEQQRQTMERFFDQASNLCVFRGGKGPIVLFIHGFPFDHTLFSAVCQEFDKKAGAIEYWVPDMPGFGESPCFASYSQERLSMAVMAEQLSRLLDAQGVSQKIYLCGLSMGGYIALEFARRYSSRLAGLILSNTRSSADSPEVAQSRRALALSLPITGMGPVADSMIPNLLSKATRNQRPDTVRFLRDMILNQSPEGVGQAACAMADRVDTTDVLALLDLPVQVIGADEDIPSPPEVMKAMAGRVPCATYSQVANAGHLTPLEYPLKYSEIILDFIK
ncbi:MAG: alpha/beta fold hydrolase [Thermoguttaceae bacterium]|nr:alpha/beta fold hydrolase [Thermoguttaceae bacterium]